MIRSRWLQATMFCGTLDALYATAMTLWRGKDVGEMWRGVAAGPLGDGASGWGAAGSVGGLMVHFTIMGAMAAVAGWVLTRPPLGALPRWLAGLLYGLALYLVMYGIVLPWRFGAPFPNPDVVKVMTGLFPHLFLVGLPMAYLLRRA